MQLEDSPRDARVIVDDLVHVCHLEFLSMSLEIEWVQV